LIDISNNLKANTAAVVEAFFKLLKISGSIQTLKMDKTDFVTAITQDFCVALGQNKTIENLVLDAISNTTPARKFNLLAKACAMNKMKDGSLSYLSAFNSHKFSASTNFNTFFDSFRISEQDHEMWYGETKIAHEMKGDDLKKKFYSGLQVMNFGNCGISSQGGFKYKDLIKLNQPVWPKFIEFLNKCDLHTLNLSNCLLNGDQFELITVAISNQPYKCKSLKVLNLSNNWLNKEHAKLLAPAMEENSTIEFLDMSQNNLGVYGVTLLARSLQKNSTLKGLNLFKNTLDVDGSRALGEMLKVNSTIEFLDVAHNRIRQKGLEAISEGIIANKNCKISTLGLRMNFINEDGFADFFSKVIFSGKSKISHLYINENNLSNLKAIEYSAQIKEKKLSTFVDNFEKLCFNNEKRMEKTIWANLGGIRNTPGEIQAARMRANEFYTKKTGLVRAPFRVKFGKKIPGKTSPGSVYLVAEFEDIRSVANVISLASKGRVLNGCRPYCAGTNTYVQIRKSKRKN